MDNVNITMTGNPPLLPHEVVNILDSSPLTGGSGEHPGNLTTTSTAPLFNFSYAEAYDILVSHSWPKRRLFSPGVELLLVVIYATLTATGFVCNVAVCCVMGRRSQRRVPCNVYVVNLAVSDLTLSLVCTPFTLLLILQRTWTMGSLLCRLLPVVQGANILVSTATIVVIAVDRYFTIVTPGGSHHAWWRCHAMWLCVGVWMTAVTMTLPLTFYQAVEEVSLHKIVLWRACIEKWPSPRSRGFYTLVVMVVQYVIPTAVMSAMHLQITRHLRTCCCRDCALPPPPPPAANRKQTDLERQRARRNQRATVTLFVIATVFAASWLPLHIFSLLTDFEVANVGADNVYAIFAACHSLAMTSACSNPILYGLMNTNFRREATKLLDRKWVRSLTRRRHRQEALVKMNTDLEQMDASTSARVLNKGCKQYMSVRPVFALSARLKRSSI